MSNMHVGKDTVVVGTGASGGVGRATARLLAGRGAKVALLARGADGLAAATREVEERGGHALAIPTDVSDAGQVSAAADAVERESVPFQCASLAMTSSVAHGLSHRLGS